MIVWRRLAEMVAEHGAAVLVRVHKVRGSAPREEGACMVVRPDGAFHGTIGGGRLEWEALEAARGGLDAGPGSVMFLDLALGPDLGQCCGGRVTIQVERFGWEDLDELTSLSRVEADGAFLVRCRIEGGRVRREVGRAAAPLSGHYAEAAGAPEIWTERYGETRTPLLLFGAGHVGRALVLALAPLPFAVRWIDSRAEAFPAHIPGQVQPVVTGDPVAELATAPPGAFVLVMTHDHPLDLAITAAALSRPDLGFVGLIGSATKRARFERRFRELGIPQERIAALACPIGVRGITAKEPAVIAASVAAQMLIERERAVARVSQQPPDEPASSRRRPMLSTSQPAPGRRTRPRAQLA